MTATAHVELARLEHLADDVGRLRRHLAAIVDDYDDTYTAHLVERIAFHVEVLHGFERPTAAELVREGLTVDAAIAQAYREAAALRARLGPRTSRMRDIPSGPRRKTR